MDVLCFSHLRWDFVFQRPNHLMVRAAEAGRVFYLEEPIRDATTPFMTVGRRDGVVVVVPHIVGGDPGSERSQLRLLVDGLLADHGIDWPVLWYYTPMALPWTRHLKPRGAVTVYDCMDHLAGFEGAPPELPALERELLEEADLVFTGGASLHEAKSRGRPEVFCMPSSVDTRHFASARAAWPEPDDQAPIATPRIGYFGVLDERLDWELIGEIAQRRADWQFVLVGPTAKVDVTRLPTAANLHYLGPKPYAELPAYLAGWDVAIMPFARNDATRYISPTKTPEYLAGGKPVASTSIRDVVSPYGESGLVHIGDTPSAFIDAVERALAEDLLDLRARADAFLARGSWDDTWRQMWSLVGQHVRSRTTYPLPAPVPAMVPVSTSSSPDFGGIAAGSGRSA